MNGHVIDKTISVIRFAEPVPVFKHDSIEINYKQREAYVISSVGKIRQRIKIEVYEPWEENSSPV